MSTISEVADAFGPAPKPAAAAAPVGPVAKPVSVRAVVGPSRLARVAPLVTGWARSVRADLVGAWPWRGTPPTLAELWARRVPALDDVPGRNRALWLGWAAYNHLLLPVFAVAYPVLWWLAHPARLLLAAMVAVPLFFVWI